MRYLILTTICFVFLSANGQKADKKLLRKVEALTKNFNGEVGIYIKNLNNGKVVAINADTIFPTASIVKVPILIGIMDKINRGELSYHQSLKYRDSLLYSDFDILAAFRDTQRIELARVMMLMMTVSDNTASLWLQSLAGTGTRINQILDSLGLRHTRVNSRTTGREGDRTRYGWGQTTPREIATLLENIYKGKVVSRAASDQMLRLMNRNIFDKASISQLPPYVAVFAKYGALNQVRSEVVLVKGSKANYVFCLATKNNKDQSWNDNNEAWVLSRKLSKLLWDYFEPRDKWEPAADAMKFH